jgi:mannonate dehydratase
MRMNRRQFFANSGAAALALSTGTGEAAPPPRPEPHPAPRPLMKLGCQSAPTNDAHLKFLARYGVTHICGYPTLDQPAGGTRAFPTLEELQRMRDLAERNHLTIECVGPAILESSFIDKEKHPAILLAQSPERDRDIEGVQELIRDCARVGLPSIKYNMSLLGVMRSGKQHGRGDEMDAVWRLADAHPQSPLTIAGHVDADAFWECITYFLDRVIPVANEYKIRMACHPEDPGVPPEGYMGVDCVLGTVDGLKKFITIQESPYNGLNFCQGTVSEMLADPGKEIYDIIRYFGTRKKIFNVNFRNIRGHRNDFVEVYPDEGDVDMVRALHTYIEVGYPYMLMPDHVPQAATDPGGLQSFAFCYGYIRGLIQSAQNTHPLSV